MRYIVLSDTIIDRTRVVIVYRDAIDPNKVWVELQGAYQPHFFLGSDARELWKEFDKTPDWRNSD